MSKKHGPARHDSQPAHHRDRSSGGRGGAGGARSREGGTTWGARTSFLGEMLRNPLATGAIAPSSKSLAREMVAQSSIATAEVVVEYGAGTGSFTGHIVRALRPGATFFAIELSESMAEIFRQRHPNVKLYVDSVEHVGKLLRREHLPAKESVDLIFSGLPWASFPLPLQRRLLKATMEVLKPGGTLLTFSYTALSRLTPAGMRMRRLLPRYFSHVEKGPTILNNLPPAFVFKCVK